ncbi:MAG: hypothetical protein QM656_03670 [Paracoccaceae bacterium]
MRRSLATFFLCLVPGAGLACALPPSVVLTLPTGHYIAGAGATVAITAVLGSRGQRLPDLSQHLIARHRVILPGVVTSYLAFLVFVGLVLIGLFGATDPMHNLLTLVFWTGVWIALPLASMVFGNLWRHMNPWTAPVRIARILIGRRGGAGLGRLGHWPAVAGLAGFLWFQLVSLSPEDPATLATAALIYWLAIFALAVAEGEDWLQQGEFLTVFMGLVARIAPLWSEVQGDRVSVYAGFPGAQVLRMPPLDAGQTAFVTLALAGLSFDGLMETFWWLALVGENPLEFTGRSAVIGVNTAGLFGAWALTHLAIAAVLRLGQRLGEGFRAGPVMLSFLAIAAGYHAAHYLTTLLTAGQFTLSALNDPLFRGDAILGMEPFYVSFGFLSDPWLSTLLYGAQFAAILGAHLLAVVLALKLSGPGARGLAHLPLAALMTGYTVFGLWLLSTARGT